MRNPPVLDVVQHALIYARLHLGQSGFDTSLSQCVL